MTSMDPALHELFEGGAPDEEVAAVIRLRRRGTVPSGVRVVAQFGEVITCRLRRSDIPRVRADENVESMKGPRLFAADYEFDASGFADFGEETRESDERRPPNEAADGRGVVVGVIDWGVDFAHPDFINDDGTTRLLAFWDQRTRPEAAAPSPYGYGEVFTSEVINRALKSRDPYSALGYHPADADADRTGTHGTHVLGIAAGNGRGGGPEGVAPAADLVFVHLSMWGKGEQDRIGDSVTIVEALDFVARTAGERPWVVNMSLGRHAGPHDGSTLVEQALDAALTAAHGRAVVQSAGNYFDRRAHSAGQLRPGESRTLGWKTDVADTTPNELDVWYPGQDHISVEVRAPDGTTSRRVELGGRDSITVNGQEVCKIYNRAEDPNNLQNHIDIFLYPGGPAGDWEVTLFGEDVVDGRYHAWIERDAACYHCQSHFDPSDAVTSTTTGTLCNGFRNIAVGAYNAHAPEFEMAPFSSGGPTRDGRIKPDLVAPGVYILSARSAPRHRHPEDSLYTRKSGTSMAAPHVTGTVALMFEVASHPLRIRDTRRLLMTSTRSVPASAELFVRVGSGVLDTARAVELTRRFFEEHRPRHTPKPRVLIRRQARARRIAAIEAAHATADAAASVESIETRAPAFIGAAAAEALRGLSELLPGHGRCEFVRPGDMIAASSFAPEAFAQEAAPFVETNESNDIPGVEIMNDEQEGARKRCRCEQSDEAAEENFNEDDSGEEDPRRNFILLSGGPGPFDNRDVEHDASWANYVTPPLLLSLDSSSKLKPFWEKDEDVWWFVYKPAYEARWTDDVKKKRSSVKEVKDKGFSSYMDMIEKRATDRGWKLSWLKKADDFWSKLKTFKNPISRVWYWGHARDDLWLSVDHSASGTAVAPSSDDIIETTDIDAKLKKRFQKGAASRVHRFVGCNTMAFATAWAKAYDVWAEGIEEKVSFVSLSKTGGEPCLVKSASVHYFKPGGTEATSGAPTSPYQTCKSLSLGEGLDFELEDDSEGEYEYAPSFSGMNEGIVGFYADDYFGTDESDESSDETAEASYESSYESDYASELSPAYTAYTPSLVEIADAAVAGGGAISPGNLLNEMLDPQGYGAKLNPLGSGRALAPAVIYDAFTPSGSSALRQHFESIFEVIGVPSQSFAEELRPGDLLIRRGEAGLGHLAIIAAPGLWHLEQLNTAGLRPEGARAGLYAHVIEGGAFPHASADGFARLVFERTGRVPHGQMVLRLRHTPATAWESEEALPFSTLSEIPSGLNTTSQAVPPKSPTASGAAAFPPAAVIDERIDVSAQFALQRMSRGDPSARLDAVEMLAAIKQTGQLAGIYGDDLKKAAELAARHGTVRWELVPKGEDAALVLEPGDVTGALPPTIIFRGGNPPQSHGVRKQPQRLDPALRKAWATFKLLRSGQLGRCQLPGPGGATALTRQAEDEPLACILPTNVFPGFPRPDIPIPPKPDPVPPEPPDPSTPTGLILVPHQHMRRTCINVNKGFDDVRVMQMSPSGMNPGFIRADGLVQFDHELNVKLNNLILNSPKYSAMLTPESRQKRMWNGKDKIRVALVDLTGPEKLCSPGLAEWDSQNPIPGASTAKIGILYSAHQLIFDLNMLSFTKNISTPDALVAEANKLWTKIVCKPDLQWLVKFDTSRPVVTVSMSDKLDKHLNDMVDAGSGADSTSLASELIMRIGFEFIASVLWQSGLRHPIRQGLWFGRTFANINITAKNNPACHEGRSPITWTKNPFGNTGITLTALSVASYFTLLMQRRLVTPSANRAIGTLLGRGCIFFQDQIEGLSIAATKCGLTSEFKHDAFLAIGTGRRFVLVVLTERDDRKWSKQTHAEFVKDVDKLVQEHNAKKTP